MTVTLRTLSTDDTQAIDQVRQYFRNYAAWLGVDLSYQNFDQEMASLPGAYTATEGRLFFAEIEGRPAGCVGVRPLPESEGVCEMKRLYVDPEERGHGVAVSQVGEVAGGFRVPEITLGGGKVGGAAGGAVAGRSGFGEGADGGEADATVAAGDEGGLAGELHGGLLWFRGRVRAAGVRCPPDTTG